jgi:uncharacterized membrane protein (DUF485 family)
MIYGMPDGMSGESALTRADVSKCDWKAIAGSKEFKDLVALKRTFVVPAFVIFLVHYFALAVLIGYAPRLSSTRVIGTVTLAYLFALSQFVVGWVIALLYLVAAARFDALSDDILARVDMRHGSQ